MKGDNFVLLILSAHFALVGGCERVPWGGLHHTELETSLYSPDFPTLVFPLWKELVTQMVKSSPAMWETWVCSMGQEEPLEKKMAMHSSILAWKIPWVEDPGGLWSMGVIKSVIKS